MMRLRGFAGVALVATIALLVAVPLCTAAHETDAIHFVSAELVDDLSLLQADPVTTPVVTEEKAAEGAPAATPDAAAKEAPKRVAITAPALPPLKVPLTADTTPAIHPASGVAPGGVGPTAAELAAILTPQNPPAGCAQLIPAWKNFVWKHRSAAESGVPGKDKYPPHIVERRFAYFCANLKMHQVQSAGRARVTVKQPNGTYKDINEERLHWNKYSDLHDLKHLRGFTYANSFSHTTTHAQYRQREFMRNTGTQPSAAARAAAEPQALPRPGAVAPSKVAATATAAAATPAQAATATTEATPAKATAAEVAVALIEMVGSLPTPVISTPTSAQKPIARDPLIPDFDFSLNSNIVLPPMDQANCGGDAAIATVALIEQTFAIQCQDAPYNSSLAEMHFDTISSQQLLSCAKGNGCKGADVTDILSYALRWPLRTRESYPLSAESFLTESHRVTTPKCVEDPAVEKSWARPLISSFGSPIHTCKARDDDPNSLCLEQDEEELARFVAKQPVTAVIDANDLVFGALYSGYIVEAKDCSSVAGAGDHVVLIVGLLTDAKTGKKVWKIQNSYGTEWGDNGYAYLEYGWNTCGISNYNHFIQTTCQRPVGPNPLPRPPTPHPHPKTITGGSLRPTKVPKKPKIVPTVPVIPVLADELAAKKQAQTPWWDLETPEAIKHRAANPIRAKLSQSRQQQKAALAPPVVRSTNASAQRAPNQPLRAPTLAPKVKAF